MIFERIYRFLNSCLTVFCNDCGNNHVALEGILISLYAWNFAPVVGTGIKRSLLVTGREFNFPIDFSTEQHQILNSNPLKVSTFVVEQARLLECGPAIMRGLIHHHRSYHGDYINQRRPNPRLFSVGDHVFCEAICQIHQETCTCGKIDELIYMSMEDHW